MYRYDAIHNDFYDHFGTLFTVLAVSYLPTIFGIKWYMRNRPGWRSPLSDNLLCAWNVFLSVSSAAGAYYTVPWMLSEYNTHGTNMICMSEFRHDALLSWIVVVFNVSKFLEFVDTLFIVLRNSHLEFLHWYHHIATSLYCWHASAVSARIGIFFAGMNLAVHAIMYMYYALQAKGIRGIIHKYRKAITLIQISQMFGGCAIIAKWFWSCAEHDTLDNPEYLNMVAAAAMYASYAVLFIQIFMRVKPKSHTE